MTSHFKRSFLLTLTPIAMLYVMTLLVPTLSKFSLNLVKIQYQLDQNSDTLQFFNGVTIGNKRLYCNLVDPLLDHGPLTTT